jgi:hypothetical protein
MRGIFKKDVNLLAVRIAGNITGSLFVSVTPPASAILSPTAFLNP